MTRPEDTVGGRGSWLPDGFEAVGPPLGAGATAVVWPARRVLDGRELALKVWRRPFADAGERARFRREIRRQAALNQVSGHIVTYTWAEEDPRDGTPWIGTPRHGESLQQLLERGGPPRRQRLVLCGDLLAGLAAMHGLGLLHRDVKPANVLSEHGRAMLCDLGLVLDQAGWTEDGAAGTPRYLAPELLAGARPAPRTDVYSAARTIREVLGPDLPRPLDRLVTAAASADPVDRPADAGEFAARFREACAQLGERLPPPLPGGSERRPAPPDPGGPGGGRVRVRVAAALAVVVVVAGVLAVVLPGRGTPSGGPGPAAASATPTGPAGTSGAAGGPVPAGPLAGPAGTSRPPAVPRTSAPTSARTSAPPVATGGPDAGAAARDIGPGGAPVVLPAVAAGRCADVVPGARLVGERPYRVDGVVVAVLRTYYDSDAGRTCAKLVKPAGSPYEGTVTHLALTLCGDGNACDVDWHGYPVDAGPVVVRSGTGCVGTRVSMLDPTGRRWLVRDDVRVSGCP